VATRLVAELDTQDDFAPLAIVTPSEFRERS
jgi:hypothetical protein